MSLLERVSDQLEKGAEFLREGAKRGEPTLIVAHYDADGLSSASIIAKALEELNVEFHVTFVEQVYPDILAELPLKEYERLVFLDLGSGYKEYIKRALEARQPPLLIIDHHLPSPDSMPNLVEVNPHLAGIDASSLSSSSTLAYLVARRIAPSVQAASCVAIAGALGDRLDNGEKFSLTGLNAEVVKEARELGYVEESIGLRLFGPKSRPLVAALAATIDPFIPGITGSESAAYEFLRRIGIEPKVKDELRPLGSLTKQEEALLATELIKHMLLSGASVREAQKIVGYNYYSAKEPPTSMLRDLREYAHVLNALGRMEQYATGIALGLGYRGRFVARAEDALRAYRRALARTLARVEAEWGELAREGTSAVIIFLEDLSPKLTGPLCSIIAGVFAGKLRGKKLVGVAARFGEGKWKVSFRRLTEEVNLGELLRTIAKKLEGFGGGHPAAGGILISERNVERLLAEV